MRFKGLDLNLLVALDVLLSEKNVSRAADKLCLSQSATSGALSRLRLYFEDDLLVQVGRKMVLTSRAVNLSDKVRSALMQIEGTIIQPEDFDPATVERTINVVASDYVVIVALAAAIRKIQMVAPNLTFVLQPPQNKPDFGLSRGEIDLLAMPEVYLAPDHPSEHYYTDGYKVLVWQGSKRYGQTLTQEEFFKAPHISMRFASHTPSFETWFVKNSGDKRKEVTVAGSFAVLPHLIERTDNIALIQGRLADVFATQMDVRVLPCPIDIPPLVEHLQWHSLADGDACLAWVRKSIKEFLV